MRYFATFSIIGLLLVVLAPVANAARPSQFEYAVASCQTNALWVMTDGKGQATPDTRGEIKRSFCRALERSQSGEDHRTGRR